MLMRSLKLETAGLLVLLQSSLSYDHWQGDPPPSLLFLRYVQTAELQVVECFSKCWTACVRRVMLGLIYVCVFLSFHVWCVQADSGYTEPLHYASGLWANNSLAAQSCKDNSYPRRNTLNHASESCDRHSHFPTKITLFGIFNCTLNKIRHNIHKMF